MSYEHVRVERNSGAMTIFLSEPEVMNAVSPVMLEELDHAIAAAAIEARAMMITGDGRGFCAGANLKRLQGSADDNPDHYDPGALLESRINPILKKLRELPIPWIAGVNGPAVGVGCGFALPADLIIAAQSAFFVFGFGRVGLAPDGGSSYLLARAVGRPRASEMLLLGERLSATQAQEWGLINRVVPDAEFVAESEKLLLRLADGPTQSYRSARQALWRGMESDYAAALNEERRLQWEAGATADHREGLAAFREKRSPTFQGR